MKIEQKKFSTMVGKYVNTEAAIQMFYQVSAFKLSAKLGKIPMAELLILSFVFLIVNKFEYLNVIKRNLIKRNLRNIH